MNTTSQGFNHYPCDDEDYQSPSGCRDVHAAFVNATTGIYNESKTAFQFPAPPFNVTSPNGQLIYVNDTTTTNFTSLDVSNATVEGRYSVWHDRPGSNTHSHIDLVSTNSNVTGRIELPGFATSIPNVSLYFWENGSEINTSIKGGNGNYRINISAPVQWPPGTTGNEYLYRMDLMSREKYFIGVSADGVAETVKASRNVSARTPQGTLPAVGSPRINDFWTFSAPVTFNATVQYANGTPINGVKLRMRTKCGEGGARCPNPNIPGFFSHKPPQQANFTGPGGTVYFNGLANTSEMGGPEYDIEVVNDSLARTGVNGFRGADFRWQGSGPNGWQSYTAARGTINVTPHVGSINGSIKGSDDAGYALIAFPGSSDDFEGTTYVEVQENHSNVSMGPLPNGTYSLVAAKFVGGQPVTTTTTVAIKKDTTSTVDMEFPTFVNLTGNVTDGSGNPVGDARVTAENRTEFRYFSGETRNDGSYRLQVVNRTNYTLRVQPPFDSSLRGSDGKVPVNGSTVHNVMLSTGARLTGYVKDTSGNIVTDGFVDVNNYSENVFAFDEVGPSGTYNVSGLKDGTTYSVSVFSSAGENRTTVDYPAGPNTHQFNITVATERANISGNVSDGTRPVNATVTLLNNENGTKIRMRTNASGGFLFAGQPQTTFYTLRVMPDNRSLSSASRSFGLFENRGEDFVLERQTGLSGYVAFSNGTTISGAGVYASNASRDSFGFARAGPDGFYSIDLKNVQHQLDVFKEGFPLNQTAVNVASGGTTQNLTLSLGESLSGYITRNKILPVNGSIGLYNFTADSYGFTRIRNGAYSMNGLKNVGHNVWLNVQREGIDVQTTTVSQSTVGGTKNFSVAGNKGQKLNITVVDSTGAAVANATVATPLREKVTDANGTVSFPNQSVGTVTVKAGKDGYRGTFRDIDISKPCTGSGCQVTVPEYKVLNGSSSTPNPVTITQIQELEVNVNVTKGGTAVSGASVVFTANQSDVSLGGSAVTGSDGRATVTGLGREDFLVAVAKNSNVNTNTTQISNGASETIPVGPYSLWYQVSKP